MLLIWGRIVIDVMDHLAGSIDHMVRQRFYQSGGIMAPSSVAGAKTVPIWHFEAFIGQDSGPEIAHLVAGSRSLDG